MLTFLYKPVRNVLTMSPEVEDRSAAVTESELRRGSVGSGIWTHEISLNRLSVYVRSPVCLYGTVPSRILSLSISLYLSVCLSVCLSVSVSVSLSYTPSILLLTQRHVPIYKYVILRYNSTIFLLSLISSHINLCAITTHVTSYSLTFLPL